MSTLFKDKTPLMTSKGAVRDLYHDLLIHKRALNSKNNKKTEEQKLVDRFKPLKMMSKKMSNEGKKDEYSEISRKSHCSSENETIGTDSFEEKKGLPTKSSDQDDMERNDTILPPLYVDIQDEIERNLK